MDTLTRVVVVAVLLLAGVIGLLAARTQAPLAASVPVPTTQPTPIAPPTTNEVEIVPSNSGAAFYPGTLHVRVGQTITWTNADTLAHSVTSDDGSFNADVLSPGQAFSWRPSRPGRYTYGDFLHPTQTGVIVVRP